MSDEKLVNIEDIKKRQGGLKVYTAAEMLALELPPRENILAPWLPTQGLAMVYGKRGLGKTHVALGVGYAVATGGKFLRWHAPKPRRVLHLDGEMPAVALRDRLATLITASDLEPPDPDYYRLLASDLQEFGLGCLATREGAEAIEPYLDGIDLVIIDNLSTLARSLKENENDSWVPVQNWALSLRRRGISVLFIHHAGKGGTQRGNSRKEDILDSVIALRQPTDYEPEQGAKFDVVFEKARGILGEDTMPFEAALVDGYWHTRPLTDVQLDQVVELTGDGLKVREIADLMSISKTKVNRLQQKAREQGLLNG